MEDNYTQKKSENYIDKKRCPFCNILLLMKEYDDHLFCHQIDIKENQENSLNINNNKNNNSHIKKNSNPHYIRPQLLNLNTINFINYINNHNHNLNQNNNESNNSLLKEDNNTHKNEESYVNKFKNYIPFFNSSKNENDIQEENLSQEEKEKRNKLEEKKAYEKKILGIVHQEQNKEIEDTQSKGGIIQNFIVNNSDKFFAAIDIVGCMVLHGPSIGRTISRVENFINNKNENNNESINDNIEENDELGTDNIIRRNPELKDKNKDIETIIKLLPITEIRQKIENKGNENQYRCIICLEEFEIGDTISTLPCTHIFHSNCIIIWIKKNCECPLCKFEVTLKSLIGE